MNNLKDWSIHDLEVELNRTQKALLRTPEDKLNWQPHPKSYTMGQLASHLANLPTWMAMILTSERFDIGVNLPKDPEPATTQDILDKFDQKRSMLETAVESSTDETFLETWSLCHGENVLWTRPKSVVFREWGVSHMAHHRGQFTVYLRLNDVPVPALYGPTADEQPTFG